MQSVTTDNNRDFAVIRAVQQKIVCEKIPMAKCVGEILQGLRQELSQLKADVSGLLPFFSSALMNICE